MEITLYKNCKLTNKYKEVFSMGRRNVLELYLNNLVKKLIEIDNTYQELNGTLVFDYEINPLSNIYEYNYMKIKSLIGNEEVIRYCFITSIELKNDLVYINYEEDIWHSYNKKIIGCNNSFLDSLRYLNLFQDYKNPHFLPIEYEGNGQYQISSEFGAITNARNYCLFIKLQYYALSSGSSSPIKSDRNEVLLQYADSTGKTTLNEISLYATIEMLLKLQNSYSFWYGNSANYFDILEFYIVPSAWISGFNYTSESFLFQLKNTGGTVILNGGSGKAFRTYTLNTFTPLFDIPVNFKVDKIGFLSRQFPVIQNGISRKCSISISANRYEFKVLFNYDNNIEDITDLFLLQPFYNTDGGEIVAQRNLEYTISQVSQTLKYKDAMVSFANAGRSYSETYSSSGSGTHGREKIISNLTRGKRKFPTSTLNSRFSGVTQSNNATSSYTTNYANSLNAVNKGVNSAVEAAMEGYINEFPRYAYTSKANVSATALINAFYGFCYFTLSSSNGNYVKYEVNNSGYTVFIPISDFSNLKINDENYFNNNNINYNVLSFSSIDIYGSFPSAIALGLEALLIKGIKIWYNENCEEDNMVVE